MFVWEFCHVGFFFTEASPLGGAGDDERVELLDSWHGGGGGV